MQSSKLIKISKVALPLLLGVFLILYSYNKFTPEQIAMIRSHFEHARYEYIALSIFLAFLSHLSRAWRWLYQLAPMGYRPKFANSLMAVLITYLVNLVVPRGGEISRALVLDKYEGIPFEKGFGTIIAERIADLMILIILIFTAFFLQFDTLYGFLSDKISPSKAIWILLFLACVGLGFLYWVFRTSSRFGNKIKDFILGVKEGVISIVHMNNKWAFIGHTFFIWGMYISMFYVCIYVLPETSQISLGAVITAFVVGSMTVAFTNGGFGTYPFLVAEILLLFQVPETVGVAFGWIVWTSQTILIIVSGSLAFLFLPILNRQK